MASPPDAAALTVSELLAGIARGEVSPEEVWSACAARIRRLDPGLKAFLHVVEEPPFPPGGKAGRLDGIPFALKDNICARSLPCTCGSRILEGFVPPYDATVTARLAEAGALLAGKTNMDEFAMGSSCEHSSYFPTSNPWDVRMVPGGSSGGSAAAVAADMIPFALGSDTGGSVRQPAAFCGVVGLKPTYGLVSRYGLVAFASSLDQIGPITKDVTDCALVLSAISGHDPLDSTSARVPPRDFTACLKTDVKGLRLGLPREYMGEGIQDGVRQAVEVAVALLQRLGAEIVECSLPHTEYAVATYYVIAPAEASSNLARYDGVRYGYRAPESGDLAEMYERTRTRGFGEEVRRRIMIGTYVLSAGYYDAYYLKAQKVRTLVRRDFDAVFATVDALVTPTGPTVAFPIGAKTADPLEMYLNDVFTLPVNLAGLPAISVPCGLSGGLPVGLQFVGPLMGEPLLLRLAFAYETASGIRHPRPPLESGGGEGGRA
jgi:aspartyl-tRNA(Asn)/glutamyl-tRNA(Gln) amidotransferase subunit A